MLSRGVQHSGRDLNLESFLDYVSRVLARARPKLTRLNDAVDPIPVPERDFAEVPRPRRVTCA